LTWGDWPIGNDPAMQIHLVHHSEHMVLQRGLPDPLQPFGLTEGFVFEKQLHSTSQPFTLRILRPTGPADWPWRWLAAIGIAMGVLVAAVKTGIDNWRARQRAESLLRIGQVARLNTLGELAGGMAHELNQPLSAVITNAQAAQRLLDDDPPEVDAARGAMAQAAAQGRRAAVVVARLRRRVETPAMAADIQPVLLDAVVARVLHLLEPELTKLAVRVSTDYDHLSARADVVALEQIVHNLLTNAMHSLDGVNPASRQLWVVAAPEMGHAVLTVTDNGPGLSEEALLRCFEPFYTTRPDGLGLGLSLCAALAESMHGQLSVRNDPPRGAQFRLQLPLAAQ
jgi:C4-dicarboxylate-specific signal transduction histidine kinase